MISSPEGVTNVAHFQTAIESGSGRSAANERQRLFGLLGPLTIAESHTTTATVFVDEFDAKPLIRIFSGSAWLRKNFPEINDGVQNRLKWSTGALGFHPLPAI